MKQLPKIELHCHLDGSLRPETILALANLHNIPLPTNDLSELVPYLIAPDSCDSLVTYLKRFDIPVALMQWEDVLTQVTYELMEDAAAENVKYIEIRFAPEFHTAKGLSLETVIESVIKGLHKGEDAFDIKGNIIISHLRHEPASKMFELVEAGKKFIGKGVVAIDLAGCENENFAKEFVEPVAAARDLGYQVTIHAGETGYVSNVLDAINLLGATRIGHGVALLNNKEAEALVTSRNVTIECCPTSNLQTKAISDITNHPMQPFFNKGLATCINTDNRTVSNTTMTKEMELLADTFDWNENHFKAIYDNSIEGAFCSEDTKKWLRSFT